MKHIAQWIVFGGIFLIPFIPLIISGSLFFPYVTGKNFAFRIIVEIIFAAWIILALYEPIYRPKFSWIMAGLASLVGVMFFANLLGESPAKSFWSNFERMDGYVTLVHLFLYVLVAGTMLREKKLWHRFFNISLGVAVFVSSYALAQLAGKAELIQSSWRLDGTLGNASYMAIYMLFHIFIAAYMFTETSSRRARYVYGGLVIFYLIFLIQTGTRGTALGLAVGTTISALYFALFTKGHATMRKAAIGALVCVAVVVTFLGVFRDSAFIENNQYLGRITNISLEQASTRFQLWGIAFDGVKERPLLGWGQENYSYVFNTRYEPSLYDQEPWFDRVHNIILDWLVAGGVLGLVAYLSVLTAALYYLFIRPLMHADDDSFTPVERGLLIGLLAGYTFHNLFVFDNIVSYIFYGTILAFIHARIARPTHSLEQQNIEHARISHFFAPMIALTCIVVVYTVNIPAMRAAGDVVGALRAPTPSEAIAALDRVAQGRTFGAQEAQEQLAIYAQGLIQTPGVPKDTKEEAFMKAEAGLKKLVAARPEDARAHLFFGSLYRTAGQYDNALEYYATALKLSPQKQQILFDQGTVYLSMGEYDSALAIFKEAYDLDTSYDTAAAWYAIAALFAGNIELVDEVINSEEKFEAFAERSASVPAAYHAKQFELLKEIVRVRIEKNPDDPDARVHLAVAYHESGDTEEAVAILEQAASDIPSFKAQADALIAQLRTGTLE